MISSTTQSSTRQILASASTLTGWSLPIFCNGIWCDANLPPKPCFVDFLINHQLPKPVVWKAVVFSSVSKSTAVNDISRLKLLYHKTALYSTDFGIFQNNIYYRINSQSKFRSENLNEIYINKKNVVEFRVGRKLPKMEEKKYKHMTLEDRIELQERLSKEQNSSFAAGSFAHSSRYFFSRYPIPFSETWYSLDRLFIVRPSYRCIRTILFLNSSS